MLKLVENELGPDVEAASTALFDAIKECDYWKFKVALKLGADVNVLDSLLYGDDEGYTALHAAARYDDTMGRELMDMLIEAGADINSISANEDRWTPLHYAVHYNDREGIELLVERGADKNIRDVKGRTPLDLLNERYKAMASPLE